MCKGQDCPIKDECYRHTAPESDMRQSWFMESPCNTKNGIFTCDMYWGEKQDVIMEKLKDIMKG